MEDFFPFLQRNHRREEEDGVTSPLASRVADRRVPPVSGWEEKRGRAREAGCAGSSRAELVGLAQLGAAQLRPL